MARRSAILLAMILACAAVAQGCGDGGETADATAKDGHASDPGLADLAPADADDADLPMRDTPADVGDPGPYGPPDAPGGDAAGDPAASDSGPPAPSVVVIPGAIDLMLTCGVTTPRVLVVQNAGTATLHVTSIVVEADPDGVFEVEPGPFDLPPGDSRSLTVLASLPGPATDYRSATLVLASDDPARPRLEVPLAFSVAHAPPCSVRFQPTTLTSPDPVDAPRDFTVNLVNTGSGVCDFEQVVVVDCPADGGDCPDPFEAAASEAFEVRGGPGEVPVALQPGTITAFTLRFLPPGSDEPVTYRALLAAQVRGAQGCYSSQLITVPASLRTPNVVLTAAP